MELLVLILAVTFIRIWGEDNPLHKDALLFKVSQAIQSLLPYDYASSEAPTKTVSWHALTDRRVSGLFSIILVVVAVVVLMSLIAGISHWLLFPFLVVILIYSFGRGDFFDAGLQYTQSCYVEDWSSAQVQAQKLGVKTQAIFQKDWQTLHKHVFLAICYRGFDKFFAVVFYFLLLGPIFALFYRFISLQVEKNPLDQASRFTLQLLDWPVSRLLGLSFAMVGNFSSCINQLKSTSLNISQPTKHVLSLAALGALSHGAQLDKEQKVSRKYIDMLMKLYQRTLWFWFAVIALFIIAF